MNQRRLNHFNTQTIKVYHKHNFFKNTYAVFKEVAAEQLPFEQWHFTSKAQSAYFYTSEGVYRKSNHWGRAAKCRWVLQAADKLYVSKGRERIGFAQWSDFFDNAEEGKYYFVVVNFDKKEVTYAHRSQLSEAHKTESVPEYRTAKETQKIIEKVKRLLFKDTWAKYYEYDDLEVLRKALILELIDR